MSLNPADVAAVSTGVGVHVHVQPVVHLTTGRIAGYEALGRVRGPVSAGPAAWLEAADRLGLRTAMELRFLEAAAGLGAAPGEVPLFVNASAATLLDPGFALLRERLPLHVLELSEHDRISEDSRLVPLLAQWREQGTPLAIDDVGAGYANMAHVLRLEPAYVKVDRSLIAGLDGDPRRSAAVAALQALAEASGAVCVAEGIERPEELAALQRLGVQLGQGFLLGRPAAPWPSVEGFRLPRPADLGSDGGAHVLAQRATAALAQDPRLLPSVYLARGGRLRCVARYGQSLVIDGIEPGVGLTGTAYAQAKEVFVQDVTGDPRYRQAVPGVTSEFAVPLCIGGTPVGVLNVDALRPLTPTDVARIRSLAASLVERLTQVGVGEEHDAILLRLGRVSRPVAMAQGLRELARSSTRAALELSSFDTAGLWTVKEGLARLEDVRGADTALLRSLPNDSVAALQDLVSTLSSCYTGGEEELFASGPTAVLSDAGIRSMLMVPLRDGRHMTGFLLATRRWGHRVVSGEVVQAAELLCMQVGSRLAALQRVGDLEVRAALDPLTGIANRSRLDALLEDPVAATPFAGGWLAAVDLDRFKDVNDFYGHAVGDGVLRDVARVLDAGPEGTVAIRIGGDEFAVLYPPCSAEHVLQECEDLRVRARELLTPYGADVSIGVAHVLNEHGVRAALAQADAALYSRKHGGRGGVTLWSPQAAASLVPQQPGNPVACRRQR